MTTNGTSTAHLPNYLTVTALTKYIKRKFEADPYLEQVYLTGEISNFRLRPNGHQYFSLKDEKSKISAIMFRPAFQKLKFTPKEGMKVLVIGRVSLYEASGNYQIYIDHMEPDGIGALYQALAERREKLAKEGLFSLPKKPLVKFPKRIAVLTSPSGAVIKDIMTTVERRFPIAQLVLYPTLVQGDRAAADIVKNLKTINEVANFDAVILARGGGSIEDLWPFNEEAVVRQIAAMKIPLISSVGHETDTTLADLVADVRAATPTAAAELAVPVLVDELTKIKEKESRLVTSFKHHLSNKQQQLNKTTDSFIFKQPERLYEGFTIKLDLLERRFAESSRQLLQEKKGNWQQLAHQLALQNPQASVASKKEEWQHLHKQLQERMEQLLLNKEKQWQQANQSLDLLSPLKTMARGYTYVSTEGKLLASVDKLAVEDQIKIHFQDGEADVEVKKVTKSKGGNEA